jgi:DNA-binding NarL/FixJ family response regulator
MISPRLPCAYTLHRPRGRDYVSVICDYRRDAAIEEEPASLIIVVDNADVRVGLRAYFEALAEFEVVGDAAVCAGVVALVEEHVPNLVLLDLIMPGMDGVETIRRVKRISPRTQLVVLASQLEPTLLFSAVKAGSVSYFSKDLKMDQVADVLRRVIRGHVMLGPFLAELVLQEIRRQDDAEQALSRQMTDRELQVLALLATGLTYARTAENLAVKNARVEHHISNILSKLRIADAIRPSLHDRPRGM